MTGGAHQGRITRRVIAGAAGTAMAPAFRTGRDLGVFAGQAPGGISVRLNGDGVAHRLRADLVASGPLAATAWASTRATRWQPAPGR